MSEESIRAVFYSYALDSKMTISGFFEFLVDADLIHNDWNHFRFLSLFEARANLDILEFSGFLNFVKHMAQVTSKKEMITLIDRVLTLETHQRLSSRKSGALYSGAETIKCLYSKPVLDAFEEVFKQVKRPVNLTTVAELFKARGFIPQLFVHAEFSEAAKLLLLRDHTDLDFPAFIELLAVSILRAPPSLLPSPKLQAGRLAECAGIFSSLTILKEETKAAEVDPVTLFLADLEISLPPLPLVPVARQPSRENRLPPRGVPGVRVLNELQFHEDFTFPEKNRLPVNDASSSLVPIFVDSPQTCPDYFTEFSKELMMKAAVHRRDRDIPAAVHAILLARAELWQATLGKVPNGFVAKPAEQFALREPAASVGSVGPLIDDYRAHSANSRGLVQPSTREISADLFVQDACTTSDVFFACELASLLVSSGEPARALSILKSVQIFVKDAEPLQQSAWWSCTGFALFFAEKDSLALRSYLVARSVAEKSGNLSAIADAYHNCGVCFHLIGRTEEARAFLSVAAELYISGDPRLLNTKRLLLQCQGSVRCAPEVWTILEPGPPAKAKKAKQAKKAK